MTKKQAIQVLKDWMGECKVVDIRVKKKQPLRVQVECEPRYYAMAKMLKRLEAA